MGDLYKKFGAVAMIVAAALNMVRVLPIYLDPEIGFDGYPPETIGETVAVAQRSGYYVSHVLVFFAAPLFVVGFVSLYTELRKASSSSGLVLSLVGFSIGQVLYLIGVVVHGVVLPEMAREYVALPEADRAAMSSLFDFNHHLATSLGGLGFAVILVSTGVLGFYMRTVFRRLGITAMALGAVALVGYLTGVFAVLLFDNFEITSAIVSAGFIFYFVTGIAMFKSPKFQEESDSL